MPDAAPRLTPVRRLAVAGSFGLFALAVAQAQPGCSAGEPRPAASAPDAADAPTAAAAPVSAEPSPTPVADAPEVAEVPAPTPTPVVGRGDSTPASNADAEIPTFLGASKSGRVMEPPRLRRSDTQQQARVPNPPQQQNAAPGT